MLNTRLFLLLAVATIASYSAFAQTQSTNRSLPNAAYDWRDTAKIPASRMAQHRQFLNHQYPYPAKPRSMWELGFGVGNAMILGDITSYADLGGAVTLRKAISHVFSLRVGYLGGYHQGYPNAYRQGTGKRAYQNWTHSETLELISSLKSISHYRGNPKTDAYVTVGASLIQTRVFFKDPNGTHIDNGYKIAYGGYNSGQTGTKSGLIATFGKFKARNGRRGWSLLGGASAGGGYAVKLGKRVNLALEQKFTFVEYDYLDAFKGGNGKDIYSFSSARLNLNLGNSKSYVEPLWWLNPKNYVYNEINKPDHIEFPPTPPLPDADNDGVTDQFDKEPNTPAGCPVDTHGVSKDTDGDGVPDCKDHELLTSQSCFPVDANGVGTCPEPACCKAIRDILDSGIVVGGGKCKITNLPSVQFKSGSAVLTNEAKALLESAASQLRANADCNVKLVGHGTTSKRLQQLSWDRVNAVKKYLVQGKGIAEGRVIFTYAQEGDENSVDLIPTSETGPNTAPAPFPNMRGK